jgi:hypothetical protein
MFDRQISISATHFTVLQVPLPKPRFGQSQLGQLGQLDSDTKIHEEPGLILHLARAFCALQPSKDIRLCATLLSEKKVCQPAPSARWSGYPP